MFAEKFEFPTWDRDVISFILVRAVIRYMDVDPLLKLPLAHRGRWGSSSTAFRKNTSIPRKMFTFSLSEREKNIFLLFYYNDCPLQKHPWQLGGHVFNSSTWHNKTPRFLPGKFEFPTWDRDVISFIPVLGSNSLDGCWPLTEALPLSIPIGGGGEVPQLIFVKVLRYVWKCTFFRVQTERKNVFVCPFITMIAPFKSTLGNWEVMCSILPHDIMKHHDFCWKIPISRPEIGM